MHCVKKTCVDNTVFVVGQTQLAATWLRINRWIFAGDIVEPATAFMCDNETCQWAKRQVPGGYVPNLNTTTSSQCCRFTHCSTLTL